MKPLVIYDSWYGNTQNIAEVVAKTIKGKAIKIDEFKPEMLLETKLLIVGSPVHGGRPTEPIQQWLNQITSNGLRGKKVAAFDTRLSADDHGLGLKILLKVFEYAAARIEKELVERGGIVAAKAAGFIVRDKQGPLKAGELDRAKAWASQFSG